MPLHPIAWPCAVYVRDEAQRRGPPEYTFSHFCHGVGPRKPLPASLRVRDLQEHARLPSHLTALRRACFLVLVAGDVAHCVSVENARDRAARIPILYRGSEYAHCGPPGEARCAEFHDDYVALRFFGTLAWYTARDRRLAGVLDLGCGLTLFPRRVREADLPRLAGWVDHVLAHAVHASVWVTEHGERFNERRVLSGK
jgi:hypothetical protein